VRICVSINVSILSDFFGHGWDHVKQFGFLHFCLEGHDDSLKSQEPNCSNACQPVVPKNFRDMTRRTRNLM